MLKIVVEMEEDICEICGKRKAMCVAEIEGAVLSVCRECAKMGKVKRELHAKIPEHHGAMETGYRIELPEEELVDDYAKRIRNALKRLKITYHVLAERLNEKESFIERITMGRGVPNEKLARRIEKELNIKLFEQAEYVPVGRKKINEEVTLGDIIEIKKKKQNKNI